MNQSEVDSVKEQLWGYYRYLNEISDKHSFTTVNVFGLKVRYVPRSLEDLMGYTRDEIRLWQSYGENLK